MLGLRNAISVELLCGLNFSQEHRAKRIADKIYDQFLKDEYTAYQNLLEENKRLKDEVKKRDDELVHRSYNQAMLRKEINRLRAALDACQAELAAAKGSNGKTEI